MPAAYDHSDFFMDCAIAMHAMLGSSRGILNSELRLILQFFGQIICMAIFEMHLIHDEFTLFA